MRRTEACSSDQPWRASASFPAPLSNFQPLVGTQPPSLCRVLSRARCAQLPWLVSVSAAAMPRLSCHLAYITCSGYSQLSRPGSAFGQTGGPAFRASACSCLLSCPFIALLPSPSLPSLISSLPCSQPLSFLPIPWLLMVAGTATAAPSLCHSLPPPRGFPLGDSPCLLTVSRTATFLPVVMLTARSWPTLK